MTEAFSLTLGAERLARFVQPFQRGVLIRMNIIDDFQGEAVRQLADYQCALFFTEGRPGLPVDLQRNQR